MRWIATVTTLLLAVGLATPALAQQGQEEMQGHGGTKAMHGEMGKMHGMHGMADMLEAHAEQLNLTDEQLSSLEALDERMETERERHYGAMESIHEDAMQVLTPEQRDRVQGMMRSMHGERGEGHMMEREHGEKEAHGEMKHDDDHDDMKDEDDYR